MKLLQITLGIIFLFVSVANVAMNPLEKQKGELFRGSLYSKETSRQEFQLSLKDQSDLKNLHLWTLFDFFPGAPSVGHYGGGYPFETRIATIEFDSEKAYNALPQILTTALSPFATYIKSVYVLITARI